MSEKTVCERIWNHERMRDMIPGLSSRTFLGDAHAFDQVWRMAWGEVSVIILVRDQPQQKVTDEVSTL
jgi:hypothetical protein